MRFAVVGDPVDHSLSPTIHRAAYDALSLPHEYTALRTGEDAFDGVIRALAMGDLNGVNVTMPLKDAAFRGCAARSASAERTRAVNTVIVDASSITGDNTDVDGVIFAARTLDIPQDTPVTVLGSGGAARAALVAMEEREVHVVARTREKAARALAVTGVAGTIGTWDEDISESLVVNATPIGMTAEDECLPESIMGRAYALVDMAYGHGPTKAVERMSGAGRPVADGITMLVGQAVRAFELFTGQPAPTDVMMTAARLAAS